MEDDNQELSVEMQLQEMDRQLSIAKDCFKLYQTIALDTSDLSGEEHKQLVKHFSHLIVAEISILSQNLIIQLHKFFDKSPQAIKITHMIKEIKNPTDRQFIKLKYDSLLSEHKEVIKKLRHKAYAHTDKYILPEDLFINIQTTYTDLKNIISALEEIISKLSKYLNIQRLSTNLDSDDVQREQLNLIRLAIARIHSS